MIILDTTNPRLGADTSHIAQTDVIRFYIKLIAFSIDP